MRMSWCFPVLSVASGVLSVIMGMRYKKSGKLMPAGIMAGLRSEHEGTIYCTLDGFLAFINAWSLPHSLLMVFRLLLLMMA